MEGRLYSESMSGATSKSNPAANKLDEKELARLQRQDYWIQITRLKLLMDLIFVCASSPSFACCFWFMMSGTDPDAGPCATYVKHSV